MIIIVMIIVICTNWPKAPIKVANAYVNYIISLIFVNSGTNLRCLKAKKMTKWKCLNFTLKET